MDLVGHIAYLTPLLQVFLGSLVSGRSHQRRQHVFMGGDVVDDDTGLDDAGPFDYRGNTVAAFPLGVLLAAKHRRATIGPSKGFCAVIGGIHDDRVLVEAQLLKLGQDLAHVAVVLDHAIGIDAQACLAFGFLLQVREDVHARGVPPEKKWLVRLLGALHEVKRPGGDFLVDRLHALLGQRAGVGDASVGEAVDDAARAKLLLELRVFRIVRILRFLLGVQVVEVAEKLIEAMVRSAASHRDRRGGSCRTGRSCTLAP